MGRRRGRGEGSVYFNDQLERWQAQLTLPNGRKKTKTCKTQSEAKRWLLEQRVAVEDNTYTSTKDITLDAFLTRYMEDVGKHTLRPKTIESYEYIINAHIRPALGSVKLTQLRPDQLQKLYADKLDAGLSNRTVRYIYQVLHKALGQAVKWGLVARNVSKLTDPPRNGKKEVGVLTPEEAQRFLEHTQGSRFYPMYCLALIGLREGEILGLHIEDFDRERHTIQIRHALQYLRGQGLVITEPKTEKAKRTLPLPDFVYQALCRHLDPVEGTQGLMFTTGNGTPFSPRNFYRDFKRELSAAGLPDIRFHDLRHTAVSLLIGMGVPPSVVQSIVGHASALLTLDVYTHTSTDLQRAAMEQMGRVFTPAASKKA